MSDRNNYNNYGDRPNKSRNKCRKCHIYTSLLNKENLCRLCLKKRNSVFDEEKSSKKKRIIICNEAGKNDFDALLRRFFDSPEDQTINTPREIITINEQEEENQENQEDYNEEIKNYPYEWLGNNIKNIQDLIHLGKKYDSKLQKRYNLNLKKMNKLVKPLQDLDNMIGLEELKQMIFEQIIYFMQDLDTKNVDMLHTVIEGPPGVGKTEISKIIARIYKGLGFLKNDKIISVKRDDFIANYLGQTASKTRKKIEQAIGGVLFIDEAYSLGSKEGSDMYSKEAIDMLTSYLSEHPHDLVCIIAGYQKSLKDNFFSKNEGLERRFGYRFHITPYDGKELRLIFFKIIIDNHWKIYDRNEIKEDFFEKNKVYFKYNGGDMLTLFSFCKKSHSKRLLFISTEKELLENKKKITMLDVQNGFKLFLMNPENKKRLEEHNLKPNTMYS
tara:strand:- start:761 stop:2089 length:1329 start_codon:yes stop_codon:yes gene_type:complete